jgi:hypothetical protein
MNSCYDLSDSSINDLWIAAGHNTSQVANDLGMARSWVRRRLDRFKRSGGKLPATADTVSPLDPRGLSLVRHSDFENVETGEVVRRWKIYDQDKQQQLESIERAIESLIERIEPAKPLPMPAFVLDDLCVQYTITDYHLGMMARASETGDVDWDLKRGKDELIRIFSAMVAQAPAAGTCIINQLGDFLHSDGIDAVTPMSRHLLDQSDRYDQLIDAATEILEQMVNLALQKHEHVHLIIAEGNHDIAGSKWLRKMFSRVFRDEPRVTVDTSEEGYYAFEFGKVMLAFHHGHLKKTTSLPQLFAVRRAEMWGRTKFRYGHSGHYHHEVSTNEDGGMLWTQHPTFSPKDAYSARHGYDSERAILYHLYHKELGSMGHNRFTPGMLLMLEAA